MLAPKPLVQFTPRDEKEQGDSWAFPWVTASLWGGAASQQAAPAPWGRSAEPEDWSPKKPLGSIKEGESWSQRGAEPRSSYWSRRDGTAPVSAREPLEPDTARRSAPVVRAAPPQVRGDAGEGVGEEFKGGWDTVLDDLKFDWRRKVFAEARSSGRSLQELHNGARRLISEAMEAGPREDAPAQEGSMASSVLKLFGMEDGSCVSRAGEDLTAQPAEVLRAAEGAVQRAEEILSPAARAGSRLSSVALSLRIPIQDLESTLLQPVQGVEPMSLRVIAGARSVVPAQESNEWVDTPRYRMMHKAESCGRAAADGEVLAGWHVGGLGLRIVLGIGNFTFEYDIPYAARPK